ncbi:carbamoyltransferase HypF [Thermodesulfovibrionales bacterium]|nr:carbamoyltransferase HypF [Thermodesulfovibrionales bacterium]
MSCLYIAVKGVVQGVGFRPFVYNLARSLAIKGYVANTSDGVIIEIEGSRSSEFTRSLRDKCPPLARIDYIKIEELSTKCYEDFKIYDSADDEGFTLISPDISVCDACLKELFDPSDRRYLYPFINCINCGPRYSITNKVPYDRQNTTMSVFNMCSQCLEEYNDPANRRFHAQPNACHECGPQVEFIVRNPEIGVSGNKDPIEAAIKLLKEDAIAAVKGLGGFHLCCDATNEGSVKKLRKRKRHSNKPFALMAPDIGTIRQFCEVSEAEVKLLQDRRRPIVLLKRAGRGKRLPDEIALNNKYLGFMLPYTPLHYLLFLHPRRQANFSALVMTSGNLAGEPIVVNNDESLSRLSAIADIFLLHNRDIFMRVDDSVLRAGSGAESFHASLPTFQFIRRSRGFAPEPTKLKDDGPDVLGCGADIKNTFTITKGDYAISSQHIGDMENIETIHFFEEALNNLKQVYRANPVAIAYDLHPGYLSTQWALSQSQRSGAKIELHGIQHHHAHIASVMAEKGLKSRVIGVAFDGTGYGTDGNLWGGEFLVCDLKGFVRAAHLKYIPLPGGKMSIKECWRTSVSYVVNSVVSLELGARSSGGGESYNIEKVWEYLDSTGFVEKYGRSKIENILRLINKKQFSPLSSSAGRLFDAVSAITGICDKNTFEGEAAIELSQFTVNSSHPHSLYPYEILDMETRLPMIVDFSKTILQILEAVRQNENKGVIAVRFHDTLVDAVAVVVTHISHKYGVKRVILSGGVFQNPYLLENVLARLLSDGFEVYTNEEVPCNDGGISLGQAYIVRERLKNS